MLLIPAAKNTGAAQREPCVPGLTWLSPREPTQGAGTAMGEPGEEHGKGEDAAPTGTPQTGGWEGMGQPQGGSSSIQHHPDAPGWLQWGEMRWERGREGGEGWRRGVGLGAQLGPSPVWRMWKDQVAYNYTICCVILFCSHRGRGFTWGRVFLACAGGF